MDATESGRRVECYLRGDTYGTYERQQAVLRRIEGLEDEDVLADATVRADWQRIRTPEQDTRDAALATYEEFREWARSNGYSLEPAFERRQRAYVGTDTVEEVVVFPVVSVAVYEEADLAAVFPCSDADSDVHFTVDDCLEAFERGDGDEWLRQFTTLSVDRVEPRLDPVRA